MPLLTSPIDGSPMRQIHRFGIELDVCPTSGGVWLDKGELEKLMAMLKQEIAAEEAAAYGTAMPPRSSKTAVKHDDDDDDDHRSYRNAYPSDAYKGQRPKKGALHHMMELFDF